MEEEHTLMTYYCTHKEDAEMWIGDTGATCHMKSSTEGMYDLQNAVTSRSILQMDLRHLSLTSESIKEMSYVLMEKLRK